MGIYQKSCFVTYSPYMSDGHKDGLFFDLTAAQCVAVCRNCDSLNHPHCNGHAGFLRFLAVPNNATKSWQY